MNKVTLQNLASFLSEKGELDSSKAETLIKTIFDTISDGLISDGIVKIKGLGTFKIVPVVSRESVNVNTGERVLIEGHGKMTFVPEQSVKDNVNKPFAQFETVVVNDGVDFSDLDKVGSSLLDNLNENIFTNQKEGKMDGDSSRSEDSVSDDAHSENIENSDQTQSSAPGVEQSEEKKAINEEKEEIEDSVDDTPDTITEDEKTEGQTDSSKTAAEVRSDDAESTHEEQAHADDSVADGKYEKETSAMNAKEDNAPMDDSIADEEQTAADAPHITARSNRWLKICGVIVICLIVSFSLFYAGFYLGQRNAQVSLTDFFVNNKQCDALVLMKQTHAVRSRKVIHKKVPKTPKKDLNKLTTQMKPAKVQTEVVNKSNAAFDSEKYDKRNRMVKYGAYKITGVEKTVELRNGETLNRLAMKYFGSKDMLCYILAINDLDKNAVVKEGQKVLIPQLELRHKKRK